MLLILKRLTVVLVLLWLSGCAQTSVRHHQDFEVIAKTIHSVVILPAEVEIELINFTGDNEMLVEKSNEIKKQIHFLASERLQKENLKVIDFDFEAEIANNEDFAYALTEAKEAWNIAKEEMYKRGMVDEKDKAKFQTNFGSVLNVIADKTGADAVLLMHYTGFEKSGGMITKDVAASVLIGVLTMGAVIPVQATQGSFIDLALVDNTSGKVVWANRKYGAVADAGTATMAFNELPNLTWKNELINEEALTSEEVKATTDEVVEESPKAN